MDEQNNKDRPKSRVKKGSNTFSYITILVIVLLAIVFYFFIKKNPSISPGNHGESTAIVQQADSQSPDLVTEMVKEHEEELPSSEVSGLKNKPPLNPVNSSGQTEGTNANNPEPLSAEDIPGQIQQKLAPESDYQDLIKAIDSFYAQLDKRPYMQNFNLKESNKIHFSKLLQKLVDNPPVVIRETDDLFTLLQNTAHFFRILGKENINILKAILSNERESFEQILEAFYKLTYHPDYLKKEYSLSIPPDALTDYAGFFLNTMGGRLYLFRRDSISRMVVSYYAIITIDRANIEGNGGHGIDLRTAIVSLIEEIENGGNRLQLKEKYLDTLYDLQEKYN